MSVEVRGSIPGGHHFKVLAFPQRHTEFDGSGMLRGADIDRPICAVGETFNMKMHRLGRDYMVNHVVDLEPDRRISWVDTRKSTKISRSSP